MQCKDHPEVPAEGHCAACAESFCGDCLVEVLGQRYCASCKMTAIKGGPPVEEGNLDCEPAGKALLYSIIGIFCFGMILGPLAIAKAIEAKKQIRADPRYAGIAQANVGLLLGITVTLLWILGVIARARGR